MDAGAMATKKSTQAGLGEWFGVWLGSVLDDWFGVWLGDWFDFSNQFSETKDAIEAHVQGRRGAAEVATKDAAKADVKGRHTEL